MRLHETLGSDGTSSVVAVVTNGNGQILMGRSTDEDRRNGKWCFTGGGIKSKEITIEQSAERECWEESGIHCRAQGIVSYGNGFEVPPSVVFVLCIADSSGNIRHNKEFTEMRWLRPSEALALPDLFQPNRSIIEKMLDFTLTEGRFPGGEEHFFGLPDKKPIGYEFEGGFYCAECWERDWIAEHTSEGFGGREILGEIPEDQEFEDAEPYYELSGMTTCNKCGRNFAG